MTGAKDATYNLRSDNVDTNAEEFYRDFWVESDSISRSSVNVKLIIMEKFGLDKFSGKKILEVGVGGEGGLIVLLQQFNEVIGVDVSDAALRNCERFGLNALKANLDRERLPFDNGHFDCVIAFEVFEHFSNPQFAIEELRRVLKDGGMLLLSTPSPYIYHWPRLFYPELFNVPAFTDFLMVNSFSVEKVDNWFVQPLFKNISMPDELKVWGWYWNCRKLGEIDSAELFENGIMLWERIDQYGMRFKPLEALELFRRCYEADPANHRFKLFFTHALLYRALNGDTKEFLPLLTEISNNMYMVPSEFEDAYVSTFCKIILEAHKLGQRIVDDEDTQRVVTKASTFPELGRYLIDAGFASQAQ